MNQKVKFCRKCGASIVRGATFCTNCGVRIDYEYTSNNGNSRNHQWQKAFQVGMHVVQNLTTKEKISTWIWVGIACIQVLAGFIVPSAWLVAAWNFFACYSNYQFIKKIQVYPVGIYTHYNDLLFSIILFMGINLVAGGVIGVVGGIYDLTIRSYAMQNKEALFCVEAVYMQRSKATENVWN